jgi:hypothetical protein
MKQTEAGKPEDALQEVMLNQTVRTTKILHLEKQTDKVGTTQKPCQDTKQVQWQGVGLTAEPCLEAAV